MAFFTPYFWSQVTTEDTALAGMFLDSKPSSPNKAVQMETQYVPSYQAVDSKGETYARIAPTSFPRDAKGDSALVHRVTAYNKSALWDSVKGWFEGAQIQIAQSISRVQAFTPSIVRADLPGGSILPIPRKKEDDPGVEFICQPCCT